MEDLGRETTKTRSHRLGFMRSQFTTHSVVVAEPGVARSAAIGNTAVFALNLASSLMQNRNPPIREVQQIQTNHQCGVWLQSLRPYAVAPTTMRSRPSADLSICVRENEHILTWRFDHALPPSHSGQLFQDQDPMQQQESWSRAQCRVRGTTGCQEEFYGQAEAMTHFFTVHGAHLYADKDSSLPYCNECRSGLLPKMDEQHKTTCLAGNGEG